VNIFLNDTFKMTSSFRNLSSLIIIKNDSRAAMLKTVVLLQMFLETWHQCYFNIDFTVLL